MPKVSVIIPVYNGAHTVGAAVNSVLCQTCQDFEIIVVDDGSTDDTAAIIEGFDSSRVHYSYQENRERSSARNQGVNQASGEYVAFLDADDTYYPNKLASQVKVLDENPHIGLVAGGFAHVDDNGRVLDVVKPWKTKRQPDAIHILFHGLTAINAVLLRKSWFTDVGGFDESFVHYEDWEFWLRLAVSGCRMVWSPVIVAAYRMHLGNSSRQVFKMRAGAMAVMRTFFQTPRLPSGILELKDAAWAHAYVDASVREYGVGEYEAAKSDLAEAIRLDPSLAHGFPLGVVESIIAFARNPHVTDPEHYLSGVASNLPAILVIRRVTYNRLLAHLCITSIYGALEQSDQKAIRQAWWRAVTLDFRWLGNKGILKIGLRALAG